MATEAVTDFLTADFLKQAGDEIDRVGFVSDEHSFAPYRETIAAHVREIEEALEHYSSEGLSLSAGFVKDHPDAGYSHFIYDTRRFNNVDEARLAVSKWLDRKYATVG